MKANFWVLCALALPGCLHAQTPADSVKLRNDCRLARQVIETGNPAPHRAWAAAQLHVCGPDVLAQANAAALDRLRNAQDTSELDLIWSQLQYVRDARIYRAAVSIAADPSATINARVAAFIWLQRLRAPRQFVRRNDVLGGFDGRGMVRGGCGRGVRMWISEDDYERGEPLPGNFAEAIVALARRVADDAGQPVDVRTAARCAQTLGWRIATP